jgi:5-methylcytosine-specific restriction endonuclease McrA
MRQTTIVWIKAALRRVWGRSQQKSAALKAAKISYGLYECALCKKPTRRKDINVDHIVAIGRFTTFDLYIERLFCDTSGLQVICKPCHKGKTKTDIKKMGKN